MKQVIRQYAPGITDASGTRQHNSIIIDEPEVGNTATSDDLVINDPGITEQSIPGSGQAESYQSPATTGSRTNGKTALITGASSGIGRELANLFAKEGYNLILVARSEATLQQLAQEYGQEFGIQATVISQDLADPSAPAAIYAQTKAQGLQVDVLVNNAGVGEYGKFATESDLDKELALIQLNSASLVHLTKLYVNDMVHRNEGKVLLLGSVASVIPHPMMAVYGATKAFNYSFGEALRNELKDNNITVTVLMPPPTDTDFFNKAGASHTVARQQAHSMTAAEVAKAGYDALMADKDKVAPGLSAKIQLATGYMLPDVVNTQNMRNLMKDSTEAKQETKKTATIAVAVGAALLGGWWLLSRSQSKGIVGTYDKAKYKTKLKSAKQSAKGMLNSTPLGGNKLTNTTVGSTTVDSALDSVKELYSDAKAGVDNVVNTVLT